MTSTALLYLGFPRQVPVNREQVLKILNSSKAGISSLWPAKLLEGFAHTYAGAGQLGCSQRTRRSSVREKTMALKPLL